MDEVELWKKKYIRERKAREISEQILEIKSAALFNSNQKLQNMNKELEDTVAQRTAELQQRFTQFRLIFDNNPLSLLVYDTATAKILDVNETAIMTYGYSKDEFIGLSILDLSPENQRENIHEEIQNLLASDEGQARDWNHITKSGDKIIVEISACEIAFEKTKARLVQISNVTEKRRLAAELKQNEEKYSNIIENLEFGLLEVDSKDCITKAYPRFCDLTGYTEEEILGKQSIKTFFLKDEFPRIQGELDRKKEGESSTFETKIRKKDGSIAWVLYSGAPIYNEYDEITGSLGIHVDITERKQMEQEIIEAKELAEASLAVKDDFLANMSHEMRTPLNAIIGMSSLLFEYIDGEKPNSFLSSVQVSAKNLLALINDILDFSKLDAGKMELERIPFSIQETVDNVYKSLGFRAEETGIYLTVDNDKDLSSGYLGDPLRINQVITNLATNAIKFTKEGGVTLKTSIIEKSGSHDTLRIEVIDTGIGIPEDKLDIIFESFGQAETGTTRKYGGTGLGLGITKHILSLYDSRVDVKSIYGEGSTFSFDVKLEKTEYDIEESKKPIQAEEIDLSGINVLLAEDHPINTFMATTILEKVGANVTHAENGKIATEKVLEKDFDVVLMDMQMPVMDGIEASKYIRKELKLALPILALTANAIKGDNDRCLDAGMTDYLSKPYEPQQLYDKLRELLANHINDEEKRQEAKAKQAEEKAKSTGSNKKSNKKPDKRDLSHLNILLAEDNPMNTFMATSILERVGAKVVHAENGKIATEKIQEATYDIVLMDLQMPEMDGLEATGFIRKELKMDLPILALTANAIQGDRERCINAGTTDYMTKPYEANDLYDKIEELVDKHKAKSAPKAKGPSANGQPDFSQLKVLLAEDNPMNTFMATSILERVGTKVVHAENGKIATEKIQTDKFDIVLMDLQMPEMDGLEATAFIRNELKMDLPILALTANAIKGDRERCINAGTTDYMTKPYEAKDLYAKMQELLDNYANQNGNKAVEKKPVSDKPDFSHLKILLAEDNPMNTFMATSMLERVGATVVHAENGLIATEKFRADSFDIVLMDLQMPEMDGLEATGVIRKEFGNEIPILALTANAIKGDRERCINAGTSDYMTKPYEAKELYAKINELLPENKKV